MKRIAGPIALTMLLLATAGRAHEGNGCVHPDQAGKVHWQKFQSEAGIAADIMMADHTEVDSPSGLDLYGFLLRGKDENCLKHFFAESGSIVDACLDAETGRTHTVIHSSAGMGSSMHILSVDPATGMPVREFLQAWVESYSEGDWTPVAPDGRCIWKEMHADQAALKGALQALRIGDQDRDSMIFYGAEELMVRPLAADAVRHHLMSLGASTTVEGPVYASEADRADWRVIQVRGSALCNAYGFVLVLNRKAGQWYSIYDVQSGCSYSLDFPLRGMRVSDGNLAFSACVDCSNHGAYMSFSIDLGTWKIHQLWEEDLSEQVGWDDENLPISDIEQAAFGD